MKLDSRVGTTFGKYNITRLIGKGGMGEVYEAYDTGKGRTVALKILADEFSNDDTFRARFQRESQAAAILLEPHVIPIHDWGEIDGLLYIDMRLVQGQTLEDLIAKGPLTPSRAVAITSQVGAALDAAHAAGLIHRDIKPPNIIEWPRSKEREAVSIEKGFLDLKSAAATRSFKRAGYPMPQPCHEAQQSALAKPP